MHTSTPGLAKNRTNDKKNFVNAMNWHYVEIYIKMCMQVHYEHVLSQDEVRTSGFNSINAYIYMYAYIHTYVCTYVRTYVCLCMYVQDIHTYIERESFS